MNISDSGTIKGGWIEYFRLRNNKRRLDRIVLSSSASGTIKGGSIEYFRLRNNKRRLDRIFQPPEP